MSLGRRILFVLLLTVLFTGISQGQGPIPLPPPADSITPDAGNPNSYNCLLQPLGCATLKELYTTTNGANWANNSNWWETGVCNFYGVECLLGLGLVVTEVNLPNNNLTGNLPSTLGTLLGTISFDLSENSISGPIPVNLLSGIVQLFQLDLSGNMLTGPLPDQLSLITNLLGGLDVRYNMINETNPLLLPILIDNDWLDTQTIPPSNLAVTGIGAQSITLEWDAILYTGDSGGYDIRYRPTSGGSWTIAPRTANKSVETITITGLAENTEYEFEIRTVTLPHASNPNTLITEWVKGTSGTVTATTGAPDPSAPGEPGGSIELIGLDIRIFDFLIGLGLGTQIQIAPLGSDDWLVINLDANVNEYLITGLDCGTTYEIRIRSLDLLSLLFGVFTILDPVTTPACAPDTPSIPAGFGTTVLSSSSVGVNWIGDDPSDTYEIQYSTDGSNWMTVTAGAGASSAVISGLDCGTTYTFRMRAVNGGLYSPYTSTAMASTNSCAPVPPATPVDFNVAITGPNSAEASWANGGGLLSYEIEASTDNLNWTTTTADAGSSSVTIDDLACGTAYVFRLRSYDPSTGMYSEYTTTLLGTTDACPIEPVELLTNGGFEIDLDGNKVPDDWRAFGKVHGKHKLTTKEKFVHSGSAAYLFKPGTAPQRSLKQKVLNVDGQAGDILVGSVWTASKGTPSGTQAKMIVVVRYDDNTRGKLKIKTPSGNNAYAEYTNSFVAAKPYSKVVAKFKFIATRGKWMIDDVSVTRQPGAVTR